MKMCPTDDFIAVTALFLHLNILPKKYCLEKKDFSYGIYHLDNKEHGNHLGTIFPHI